MELYKNYLHTAVTLVGCGGMGSHLRPVLSRLGVVEWTLYDNDIVAPKNLAAQNFAAGDVGLLKCDVLAREIMKTNPQAQVRVFPRRFIASDSLDGIAISAVDSMETGRHVIFDAVCRDREKVPLYIDGRMNHGAPEFCTLFAIDPTSEWEVGAYRKTLFKDGEAFKAPRPDRPSAHTPVLLAGLIGAVLARWTQKERRPWRVTYDASVLHGQPYYAPANSEGSKL
jgi:hypothetical protein